MELSQPLSAALKFGKLDVILANAQNQSKTCNFVDSNGTKLITEVGVKCYITFNVLEIMAQTKSLEMFGYWWYEIKRFFFILHFSIDI